MNRVFITFIFHLFSCGVFAQLLQYNQVPEFLNANAYWAYYNHIGLDWSGGQPVYDSTALTSWHPSRNANVGQNGYNPAGETGAVSVSDPHTGKLLFYTNGGRIWYSNHETMQNGDTLRFAQLTPIDWRNRLPSDPTSPQGTCVVPFPGDSSRYYVFTLESDWGNIYHTHQLHYSVVDTALAGGKGAVVDSMKNQPLFYNNTRAHIIPKIDDINFYKSSMVAIPGNNCDVWLLTYAWKHNERSIKNQGDDYVNAVNGPDMLYYAFHITEEGIDTVPVISNSGLQKLAISFDHMNFTVSPDRSHILFHCRYPMMQGVDPMMYGVPEIKIPMHTSELSRFDPATGKVYDPIPFDFQAKRNGFNNQALVTDFFNIGSAAFSTDNRYLYLISANFFASETYLYQFDISTRDSISIAQSRLAVDSLINPPNAACYEVSPITLRSYKDTIFAIWGFQPKIGSINQPEQHGVACDFQRDYFSLPLDKPNGGCFVNEVVYPMYLDNALVAEMHTCEEQELRPRVSNASVYQWSNGARTEAIKVQQPGTYWVSYSVLQDNCIQLYTDTFRITADGFEVLVNVNIDTLGTVQAYTAYQWLYEDGVIPGATGRYHVAQQNGNYRVIATNQEGCRDTSDVYAITSLTHIRSIPGTEVRIYPNPAEDIVYIQSAVPLRFQLVDMSGRMVIGRTGGNKLDISAIAPGGYQLVISDAEGAVIGYWKVVKQ